MLRKPVLSALIITLLILLFIIPSVYAQGPSISVNPSSGEPGSGVHLSGSGFAPNIPCDIIFGNYGTVGSYSTDPNGETSANFTVPGQASPGQTQVQVNCPQAQQSASTSFSVITPPPPTHETPTAQATKTCQELQNCTPTPTATFTFTLTPATLTPNDTLMTVSPNATANPLPGPNGQNPPAPPLLFGRLMMIPLWVYIVVGVWILGLLGLTTLWLLSRRSTNPRPPGMDRRMTRPPAQKFWGGGTVMWLIIGLFAIVGRDLFPPSLSAICGIDNFPDLTVKSVEVRKSDYVYVTIANIGPCNMKYKTNGSLAISDSKETILANFIKYVGVPEWVMEIEIPILASGETTVRSYFMPGVYGKPWVGYKVDAFRLAKEDDEYNNVFVIKPVLSPVYIPTVCGVDNFPDLSITNFEVRKSDYVYVTIANIGPCNMKYKTNGSLAVGDSEETLIANFNNYAGMPEWVMEIEIPILASGETTVRSYFMPGVYGKPWVGYKVDAFRIAKEENEYNNVVVVKP